jgi:alkaline phosphatase D
MMANLNTDMMGGVVNPDQWHGYPASRARFLDAVERMGTENVVVLTGDLHTSIASELVVNSLDPAMYDPATGEGAVAVEFLCPGITSPGLPATFRGAIEGIRPFNPHVRWFEITQRGYVVLDVDRARTQAAWFLFEDADIVSPTATIGEALGAVWSVATGTARLVEETQPAAPRPDPPLPAPEP